MIFLKLKLARYIVIAYRRRIKKKGKIQLIGGGGRFRGVAHKWQGESYIKDCGSLRFGGVFDDNLIKYQPDTWLLYCLHPPPPFLKGYVNRNLVDN